MAKHWRPIETAPKDGTVVEIRGKRFMRPSRYKARAIWTRRRCPAATTGWFPEQADNRGPFLDVTDWRPV